MTDVLLIQHDADAGGRDLSLGEPNRVGLAAIAAFSFQAILKSGGRAEDSLSPRQLLSSVVRRSVKVERCGIFRSFKPPKVVVSLQVRQSHLDRQANK